MSLPLLEIYLLFSIEALNMTHQKASKLTISMQRSVNILLSILCDSMVHIGVASTVPAAVQIC